MRIDVDLRRLRFFVEVVRHGGFSQAAKVVHTTQSTVSKAIKLLEEELGVTLLNRIGRRNHLTTAGHVVHARALALLASSDGLVAELEHMRGVRRGSLSIGFPRAGSSSIFAATFAAFRHDYPGVDVKMVVQDRGVLEDLLQAGELDLAAFAEPVPRGFQWQHVRTDPIVVLLHRDHALAERHSVDLVSLQDQRFILFDEDGGVNNVIMDACSSRGFEPQIATRTGQLDFMFELVAERVGVAFLPCTIAERWRHRMVRTVLLAAPACHWRVALAWRQGGYLSPAARAWLAHVRQDEEDLISEPRL